MHASTLSQTTATASIRPFEEIMEDAFELVEARHRNDAAFCAVLHDIKRTRDQDEGTATTIIGVNQFFVWDVYIELGRAFSSIAGYRRIGIERE